MSDSKLPDLRSMPSSLGIDEAILRSRKVMEESKALTLKNNKKKSSLEEKFKNVLGDQIELYEDSSIPIEVTRNSLEPSRTPKILNQSLIIEELQNEIRTLNNKLSSQSANLRLSEINLEQMKSENYKLHEEINKIKVGHRHEINYLTEIYEQKLKNSANRFFPNEMIGIESRIRDLEDKFQKQLECNFELIQKINEMNKNNDHLQKTKTMDFDKNTLTNREKYETIEYKLDNLDSPKSNYHKKPKKAKCKKISEVDQDEKKLKKLKKKDSKKKSI